MIVLAWAVAVVATTVYGLLLTVSDTVAQAATPVLLVLVLPAWAYLAHHYERTRHRDQRRPR
jgi:hypothetical protein